MKHIGNKGFAISTILYGILSLTVIILMIIFAIMKSSKDVNQDFIETIETQLNKCVASEVELENCYFDGGSCDTSAYYSCIDKKDESVRLANVAKIGDYVSYDAGNWANTVAVPTTRSSYTFGGYRAGESRNKTVTCTSNDHDTTAVGWRILSIENDVVTLIHTGISECFLFYNNYYAQYVLTGEKTASLDVGDLVPRDWSDYINPDFATSASILTKSNIDDFYGYTYPELLVELDDVFSYDGDYILGDTHQGQIRYVSNGYLDYGVTSGIAYGIKPIIILKESVKTSGSLTNTFGQTEWILVK